MKNRPWRLAYALQELREQLDDLFPERSKKSDGSIGDAKHASRSSDHNPHVLQGNMGIVTAIDITHDPASGVDGFALSRKLILDYRVKYVIWNRQIYNKNVSVNWRTYRGSNPHDKHVHVSVLPGQGIYDSRVPWVTTRNENPSPAVSVPLTLNVKLR